MKRFALLFSLILVLISFTSCIKAPDMDSVLDSVFNAETLQEKVSESIGECDNEVMWTHGGFQDYTDYGIYSYSSVNLKDNQFLKPFTDNDIEKINGFIDNFESWVDTFKENAPNDELVLNYKFDRSVIDNSDYFYISETDSDMEFSDYDVFIFDSQTNTLYYFHNNI